MTVYVGNAVCDENGHARGQKNNTYHASGLDGVFAYSYTSGGGNN